MPRVISFIVLLTISLLVGAIFFQVMAQFIVPLFLAAVLVVIFQPLHAWMVSRLPSYPRVCALFTTILILLAVLLPITWLGWKAYADFHKILTTEERASIAKPAASATPPARQPQQARQPQPTPPPLVQEDLQLSPDDAAVSEEASAALIVVEHPGASRLAEKLNRRLLDVIEKVNELTGLEIRFEHFKPLIERAAGLTGSVVLVGVQTVIGILIGLAIMVISLYYFLADGPAMVRALMYLSPLEAAYERELLARFGQVSRAVVVAVLLSAAAQGSLAGIGYHFALPETAPIFLLTALTMVTAIVPFVGAAAVWIPVCIWVFFYGERVLPTGEILHDGNWIVATVLAVYSTIVVSGIDNVIKPLVLHGQSNLHPLLALLSILGGVQVLGPVGILVGPMLVSFLQALLIMLRKEIDTFGDEEHQAARQLADRDFNVPQNVVGQAGDSESESELAALPAVAGESTPAAESNGAEHVDKSTPAGAPTKG